VVLTSIKTEGWIASRQIKMETLDGLFRNDGGKFVDVAGEMKMDPSRGAQRIMAAVGLPWLITTTTGCSICFVAGVRTKTCSIANEGNGTFRNVCSGTKSVLAEITQHPRPGATTTTTDVQIYTSSSYIVRPSQRARPYVSQCRRSLFSEVIPWQMLKNGATHGIQWVDFDGNGALDLATCNNNPEGHHYLWRNLLPPERAPAFPASDGSGQERTLLPSLAQKCVSLRRGTRTILGTRIIDTGGGYCSQNIMPVHFGASKGRDQWM